MHVKVFIDFVGAEMLNERSNPEGVDFDDNYKIEVTHKGNVLDSTAIAVRQGIHKMVFGKFSADRDR